MEKKQIFKELDELLTGPIPNFKKIEKALEKIPPAALAIEIQEDVGFAYLMDYYFHYIDEEVVKNILQNPFFSHEALFELFSCHVTSYHKAILQNKPKPEISGSYWRLLTKAEFAILFKNMINRPSSLSITRALLEKLDIEHLKLMTSTGALKSGIMLKFLKQIGADIQQLAARDMNFFDYAFNLAHDNSDDEYINFLEDYTTVFVQLRVASFFVEEVQNMINQNGKVPVYQELIDYCASIPLDSLKVTLDIFQQKGWVSENENESILEHFLHKDERAEMHKAQSEA